MRQGFDSVGRTRFRGSINPNPGEGGNSCSDAHTKFPKFSNSCTHMCANLAIHVRTYALNLVFINIFFCQKSF